MEKSTRNCVFQNIAHQTIWSHWYSTYLYQYRLDIIFIWCCTVQLSTWPSNWPSYHGSVSVNLFKQLAVNEKGGVWAFGWKTALAKANKQRLGITLVFPSPVPIPRVNSQQENFFSCQPQQGNLPLKRQNEANKFYNNEVYSTTSVFSFRKYESVIQSSQERDLAPVRLSNKVHLMFTVKLQ